MHDEEKVCTRARSGGAKFTRLRARCGPRSPRISCSPILCRFNRVTSKKTKWRTAVCNLVRKFNTLFWWLYSYSLGTCATRTKSNFCCVFPFMYKGRRYNSCTRIKSPKGPWCATTPNYDADKMWGYCPRGGGNFVLLKLSDITWNFCILAALSSSSVVWRIYFSTLQCVRRRSFLP